MKVGGIAVLPFSPVGKKQSLRVLVKTRLESIGISVSRHRPYIARLYPYKGRRKMLDALGPALGEPTAWTADDIPPTGELAAIFESLPDVHKWAHYLPTYEHVLAPRRFGPIRMVEIGVFRGGSLEMWRRYLHPDSIIIGIDIDPECKRFDDPRRNIHVRIGSQADPDFLQRVADEFGPFDVILDDGSHVAGHMITTFQHMFGTLKDGGAYLVEDIHANYWLSYRDGPESFFDFTKHVLDAMHAHYPEIRDEYELRVGNPQRRTSIEVPRLTTMLSSVEVFDSVVVFHKKHRDLPRSILH